MPEDQTPGFEQPDIDHLRSQMKQSSIWSRIGSGLFAFFTNRTVWTVVLALLIVASLIAGYQLLATS